MTRRKTILFATLGVVVLATTLMYVWSWGYNAGHMDGRKEAMCSQAQINYDMAVLLDNPAMIEFSKEALAECCRGEKTNGR